MSIKSTRKPSEHDLIITGKELKNILFDYEPYHAVRDFATFMKISKPYVRSKFTDKPIPYSWAQGLAIYVGGIDHLRLFLKRIREKENDATQTNIVAGNGANSKINSGETPERKTKETRSKGRVSDATVRNISEVDGKSNIPLSTAVSG